jgi:membrane-bound serine protease (ClpP class)
VNRYAGWVSIVALLAAVAASAAPAGAQSPQGAASASTAPPILLVQIDGAIGPATADRVTRALDRAARDAAQLVVLQMDTPGGLDTAMRSIIKAILASPVPVVGFVGPQGARAASAGTYILYATHVAAMAPATNLGAATPIAVGMPGAGDPAATPPPNKASGSAPSHDAAAAKRVSDAQAYIRGLAQLRGRDVAWAELAVREAVSLPATDALARKVIDVIAADVNDLMRQLDGRVIQRDAAHGGALTLRTAQAAVRTLEPDWRERLLAVVSDPSLALVLLMIGVYGLLFEFMNPGYVAPGVIGGVSLLLALWGLQMLPINYAGLALILLGIAFFVAEAFVPSYGVLGLGGVAAFVFGAVLLIDSETAGFGIPVSLIAGVTLLSATLVIGIAGMAAKARRRPVVSGSPTLLGTTGEVIESAGLQGWASINGERWQVRATEPLQPGQRVRVIRVDQLTLEVSPVAEQQPATTGASR